MAHDDMRQVLHLLAIDIANRRALAAWYGSRWLLPVLTCGERWRAALLTHRWMASQGVDGDLVGQWLGRIGVNSTDWLVVIAARLARMAPPMQWLPIDALLSNALVEYQGWAVARTLARTTTPAVDGPFGTLTWLDDVKGWIHENAGTPVCSVSPFRAGAHEVVLGVDTARGRLYFKGLPADRSTEVRLTRALSACAAASFATTIASEERPDGSLWWLCEECPGAPAQDPILVVRALARMQEAVTTFDGIHRELPALDLEGCARGLAAFLEERADVGMMNQCLERVAAGGVCEAWIPLDLHVTNVLVDASFDVRFIDLDASFYGPAPLAATVFADRCGDRRLYGDYERSWSAPLGRVDWPAFETTAIALESWLGWQRVERHARRGELHGALDLAATRVRERLIRAIHRR